MFDLVRGRVLNKMQTIYRNTDAIHCWSRTGDTVQCSYLSPWQQMPIWPTMSLLSRRPMWLVMILYITGILSLLLWHMLMLKQFSLPFCSCRCQAYAVCWFAVALFIANKSDLITCWEAFTASTFNICSQSMMWQLLSCYKSLADRPIQRTILIISG